MNPLSQMETSPPLSWKWTDAAGRKSVRTELNSTTASVNGVQWTSVDYFIQQWQNTHSSQLASNTHQDRHIPP